MSYLEGEDHSGGSSVVSKRERVPLSGGHSNPEEWRNWLAGRMVCWPKNKRGEDGHSKEGEAPCSGCRTEIDKQIDGR